ncbi:MAG: Cof-type HAD-IIB family hydrolase [Bacteroidales bacterium]
MNQSNNYQIVFSDVDGTLLNKNRELSNFTVQEIKRIAENYNVKFVMVSARMPKGMQHLYNQLSTESPIICYNGALILKSLAKGYDSKNILHSNTIAHNVVLNLYNRATAEDVHFGLFSNNNWYANRLDKWTLKEENNTRVKCSIVDRMDNLIDELHRNNEPIHKLMVMGEPFQMDSFIEYANMTFGKQIANYRSKDTYIEISPIDSNKASGCSFLLNHLTISNNNAIAFGDNFNDIGMLELVNLGIAMENAPNEVKKYAKHIAPSNLQDGVANTISAIFK